MVKINVEFIANLNCGRAFHPIACNRRAGLAERPFRAVAHGQMQIFLHRILGLVLHHEIEFSFGRQQRGVNHVEPAVVKQPRRSVRT